MGNTYRDKWLKMREMFKILKQIKADNNSDNQRKFDLKKSIQTTAHIAAVTTEVDADDKICIKVMPS